VTFATRLALIAFLNLQLDAYIFSGKESRFLVMIDSMLCNNYWDDLRLLRTCQLLLSLTIANNGRREKGNPFGSNFFFCAGFLHSSVLIFGNVFTKCFFLLLECNQDVGHRLKYDKPLTQWSLIYIILMISVGL
jgi:hypothetical protein